MIDNWKDAFTIVGGFAATALTVVTISKSQSSKPEMEKLPVDLLSNLTKLSDSNQAVLIQMAEFGRDLDHLKGDLKNISKRMEADHMTIKLLREILISWGKMDAQGGASRPGSDTETGEI